MNSFEDSVLLRSDFDLSKQTKDVYLEEENNECATEKNESEIEHFKKHSVFTTIFSFIFYNIFMYICVNNKSLFFKLFPVYYLGTTFIFLYQIKNSLEQYDSEEDETDCKENVSTTVPQPNKDVEDENPENDVEDENPEEDVEDENPENDVEDENPENDVEDENPENDVEDENLENDVEDENLETQETQDENFRYLISDQYSTRII